MRVSYNELLLTSQKVFEGLNYSTGTYEDAAETIAWLELHGLPVLDQVLAEIDRLQGPLTPPIISVVQGDAQGDAHEDVQENVQEDAEIERPTMQVRLNGKQLLVCASFVVDYLMVLALERGQVLARVEDAANGFLLLPHLARYAQNGIEASASWFGQREGTRQKWHRAQFKEKSSYPQLLTVESPANESPTDESPVDEYTDQDEESILLSLQIPGRAIMGNHADKAPASNQINRRYPRWFQNQAEANMSKGVEAETPLWQAWTRLAKAVLVEATEESRLKGAGEQSAKVNY